MKNLIILPVILLFVIACTTKKRKVRLTKSHDGRILECVMTGKKYRAQYMPDRNGYHLQPTDTIDFEIDPLWGDTNYVLGFKTL